MDLGPSPRGGRSPGNPADEAHEFNWTPNDFTKVQSLIYQRAGIRLHDGKHAMVYSRLSRRLRETGHRSFHDYLSWLQGQDGQEWQEFVNALTTNLTSFFRESHHFEMLAQHLRSAPNHGPWRIWCNAASTGEEPYSIAMTATEALGQGGNFSLLASDIDSRVLARAAQGIYPADSLRNVSPERLQRFFMRGSGANAGLVRVRPELQRSIEFTNLNLISEPWSIKGGFDVLFCRNVMIYFDAPTQRRLIERMHQVLNPGGLLFVGHAENLGESRDLFTLRGKTVYVRR
jgi:chemotaxis protein methyltransferase CheR